MRLQSGPAAAADGGGHVELSIGLCTCPSGAGGGPCIHQWAAILHTQAQTWLIRSTPSTAAQRLLAHIATGRGYAESSWFASSHPLKSCSGDTVMIDDTCSRLNAVETLPQSQLHRSSSNVETAPQIDVHHRSVINYFTTNGLPCQLELYNYK